MLDTILSDSLAGAYVNSRRSAVFPEMLGFSRKDDLLELFNSDEGCR